jgi:hypothetical protein
MTTMTTAMTAKKAANSRTRSEFMADARITESCKACVTGV